MCVVNNMATFQKSSNVSSTYPLRLNKITNKGLQIKTIIIWFNEHEKLSSPF